MKELFNKLIKRNHHIVVDDANLAMTAAAVYDTLGRRNECVTFERVWRIGGQEWLIRFSASDAQCDEIKRKLGRI